MRTKKYIEVYNKLRESIAAGEFRPGDKLPSEDAMAKIFNVSVGTIKKSLDSLSSDGLVVKKHGSGTYVTIYIPRQNEIFHFFFHKRKDTDRSPRPVPLYTKVISINDTENKDLWGLFLPGRRLMSLTRIINVNLEFQIFAEMYLDYEKFKYLFDIPISKLDGASLYRTIFKENNINYTPSRFIYEISLDRLPPNAERTVGTPKENVMRLDIKAFDVRGDPLFYQVSYIPKNNFNLQIQVPGPVAADTTGATSR